MDIWRFGPPRLNWCMAYEAKNQPLKRGCKRSNFKNAPKSTAEFWAESTDFHLQRGQGVQHKDAVIPGQVVASGTAAAFPHMTADTAVMASLIPHEDELVYNWLESATVNNQEMSPGGYCEIEISGASYLAKIESLIAISGNHFMWLLTFPTATTYSYDQNGVLSVSAWSLRASRGKRVFLTITTHGLACYWHFRQSDGSTTFIAKW